MERHAETHGEMRGLQVAFGANITRGDVQGFQVAMANITDGDVRGFQMGLFNISRSATGSLGLVNWPGITLGLRFF